LEYYQAILLGVLQGLTEFLPVSSSGHLVIAKHILPNFKGPGLVFDTMLHLGTLGAVFIYFRKDLLRIVQSLVMFVKKKGFVADETTADVMLALAIIAGTIPTGIIGLTGKDFFESLFESPAAASAMLLVTCVLLLIANRFGKKANADPASLQKSRVGVFDGLLIGLMQGFAIIPGISRSGSTVAVGMMLNVEGREAARFSFLLGIPAILGAGLLQLKDISNISASDLGPALAGTGVAMLVGVAAIGLFIKAIGKGKLWIFAIYCALVGSLGVTYFGILG
jgi:undecaprenyl-diphosphatase